MAFIDVKDQLSIIKRGVEEILPEAELVKKLEKSRATNTPLRIKLGCDPSRPDLHIGHGVVLRKLRHFQDLGHQAILVIGDFTASIGDPSGKNKTRPQITLEETRINAETYVEQAEVILDVDKLEVVYNSSWLDAMNFSDVIRLASKYTVARMMERDDFTKRFKSEIPISLHEILYPLAQGMDSVHLNADVELGGTDQKFNLLVGRDLQRESEQAPQVIITLPLLEGTDGVEKMSKSYGNHIGLADTPDEMFGKTLSIPDTLIGKYFKLAADFDEASMKKVETSLNNSEINPRDIKRELARAIVTLFYSEKEAFEAQERFDRVFISKDAPDDMPEFQLSENAQLIDVLLQNNLIESKGAGRRLISQNAVRIDNELVSDATLILKPISEARIIKVGKRRFLKILS